MSFIMEGNMEYDSKGLNTEKDNLSLSWRQLFLCPFDLLFGSMLLVMAIFLTLRGHSFPGSYGSLH